MMLKLIKTIALPAILILVVYAYFAGVVRANEPTQTRKTNIQPGKNEYRELAGRESDHLKITNIANSPSEITAVPAQDSLALVALYNSTNGTGWTRNDNWLSANPVSTWYGVTVSGARVTEIDLYHNNLNGQIPSQIGDLTALVVLYCPSNLLNGPIPQQIGKLTRLQTLGCANNQISGQIPSEIGSLSNLVSLNLTRNQLEIKFMIN